MARSVCAGYHGMHGPHRAKRGCLFSPARMIRPPSTWKESAKDQAVIHGKEKVYGSIP